VPHHRPVDSLKSPRFVGVATFARLPHVQDLDGVDVAFVGVPFDTGVTNRPGGRYAPNAIRAASIMIRQYNAGLDVKPFDVLSCIDFGDVPIVPGFIEASYDAMERTIEPLVARGVTPILLGGDHSCSLGHLRAFRSHAPLALVMVDSHTDCWDDYYGQKYTHGTWVRRAIEEELIDPARSILVGLRGSLYDKSDWTSLEDELGLAYLTAEQVHDGGIAEACEQVRRRVGSAPAYMSFDIDSVDPAFAPGTGTPEVGGFSSLQALRLIRGLAGLDFRGFDLVEVIPAYDPAQVTATLAANLAWEMLSITAVHRRA
jgi:agmatinase